MTPLLMAVILLLLPMDGNLFGGEPGGKNLSGRTGSALTASKDPADKTARVPVYGYRILNRYPHDPKAFTQGLLLMDGFLYESTGLRGASTLRKVRLRSGEVIDAVSLDPRLFGEGLAAWRNVLIQLTWKAGRAFIYDKENLKMLSEFTYEGEGWGLTRYDSFLVMSNGSSELRFLDPSTFRVTRRIRVKDGNKPVTGLNELETVENELFANVWGTDWIARISPENGKVLGWVDLSDLGREMRSKSHVEVLNGIAYDPSTGGIYVTGKLWPELFEIELLRMPVFYRPYPKFPKSTDK